MSRGRFITVEGGEGVGKSTQVGRLVDALHERGITAHHTREPGGSPGAEDIRQLLVTGETGRWDAMTETLLFFAARRDHLVTTVWPALERGAWVVSDRFADTTVAYQGYAHGLDRETIGQLYALVVGDFAPDLTIILDAPVDLGLARAGGRGGDDRYERMDLAFHERLRAGFLEIARGEPDRCVVIDASAAPDAVHRIVLAAVVDRFGADQDG